MSQDSSGGSEDGRRGRNTAALVAALIVGALGIVAAVAGAVTSGIIDTGRGGSTAPTTSNPTHPASFNAPSVKPRPTATSPVASIDLTRLSVVPECATISGYVSTSMARGKQLWLFMKISKANNPNRPSNTFYFLNPLHPDSEGVWSSDIHLGDRKTAGSLYWLEVVSSDPSLTGRVSVKGLGDGSTQGYPRDFNHPPLTTLVVVRGVSNSVSARHDVCRTYVSISAH